MAAITRAVHYAVNGYWTKANIIVSKTTVNFQGARCVYAKKDKTAPNGIGGTDQIN